MTSFPGMLLFFFRKSDKKWIQALAGRFGSAGSTARLAKPGDHEPTAVNAGNDAGKPLTDMPLRHVKPQGVCDAFV